MKKLLIAVILCSLTLASVYAGTNNKKGQSKEKDINIHIDKKGEVHINATNITEKDIEKWVADHLKNITIDIDDNTVKVSARSDEKGKKDKTVQLSLTIKEK